MPIAIWWVLGAFGVGAASGFALSSGTKTLLIYGAVGYAGYYYLVKK